MLKWIGVLLAAGLAQGGVTKIHVLERSDVLDGAAMGAAGPYERVIAKVYFAIDPKNPSNRIITDIDLAPRNEDGQVEFSADLYLLKPRDPAKGNGTVFFEVANRGRKGMISTFNRGSGSLDPRTEAEFGDRMLLEQGFTLAWLGWQADVPNIPKLVRLYAPAVKGVTGLVRANFVPDRRIETAWLADRDHIPYAPVDPNDPKMQLTVRERAEERPRPIAREKWRLDPAEPGRVIMPGGFEPGKIYEVTYTAKDPTLVGLGPTAIRDLISFLKYTNDGLVQLGDSSRHIKRAIGFGTSQSGRFLRTFLYYGFNQDEKNRQVFDGVWAHVAGAGRGSFNHRFAQPSRDAQPHMNFFYPTILFPFTDTEQTDSETGLTDGLMSRARKAAVAPKVFYTNGSYEYYGRSASLIHTSVDARTDVTPPPNTRIYLIAGAQHGPGNYPPSKGEAQNLRNAVDFRWTMRALLAGIQGWVKDGAEPPASQFPLVGKDQLVAPGAIRFPKIAGVTFPKRIHEAWRLDFGSQFRSSGITSEPPKLGKAYPTLLPQVDMDGNETSGIRLPDVQVPLATHAGWNLRAASIGAPDELLSMVGSYIPFARTKAEREKTRDPRPSIEERYKSKDEYLARVRAAAEQLVKSRYVLESDVTAILEKAAAQWDHRMAAQ